MKILSWAFLCLFAAPLLGATVETNKQTVHSFLSLVGSEKALGIIKSGKLPELLKEDVFGRVNPAGIFKDQEGTIEYFLGLGGAANVPDTAVDSVDIQTLIGDGNMVYAHFVVSWKNTQTQLIETRVALDARFKMADDGRIQSYDLNAINLGKALDDRLKKHKFLSRAGMCALIQKSCTGENEVYKNYVDCLVFMNSIPLGTYYEAQANSVTCRSVHMYLAEFRPEIHCPHVSKSGGEKCIDVSHDKYFEFSLDHRPDDSGHGGH